MVPARWERCACLRSGCRDRTLAARRARPEESMELRGRTALVTGAGHRIGRELAAALGARGMRVAVHYHATSVGADETVRLISAQGGIGVKFSGDLTEPDTPRRLIDEVVAHFGGLDVLINSAAMMVRTPFETVTPAQWDTVLALNLRAPFFLAQAAAPHLRRAENGAGGAIVNIADLAAFETWPGYLPHGVSKAGVVYLTR